MENLEQGKLSIPEAVCNFDDIITLDTCTSSIEIVLCKCSSLTYNGSDMFDSNIFLCSLEIGRAHV